MSKKYYDYRKIQLGEKGTVMHGFLAGLSDIGGLSYHNFKRSHYSISPEEAVFGDWARVGDDMKAAMSDVRRTVDRKKKRAK